MTIRESAEMYLETIYVLSQKGKVRSIDIAKSMGFSRPSVSVTIHNLENNIINRLFCLYLPLQETYQWNT